MQMQPHTENPYKHQQRTLAILCIVPRGPGNGGSIAVTPIN
jgi:hypothetical protein